MKRALAGILFSSVLATASLSAADAVTLAAQQEAEERYKNLLARFEEMQAAQMALEKRISAMASDFGKLRDEVARNNNNTATQESIRKLNEQILKVDESRIADNKRIQEGLEKLGTTIKLAASTPRPRVEPVTPITRTPPANTGTPAVQDGFEYIVQSGDNNLGVIVKRLSEEKIIVTSKAIMEANPTVDWRKLKIGQKIFIPKPK
jgi:predicted RNase H-like nuclease (RuvC/YqgF family)